MRTLLHGCLAGAAGTTALNAATYLDMAVRGRPASSLPEQAVERTADALGTPVPGSGEERDARLTGLGALDGIVVGTAVGAAVAVLRRAGVRPPLWAGSALTAVLAMAAANLPMARMGLTDPRTWTPAEWLADAVPHAAYGLVTYAAVSRVRAA